MRTKLILLNCLLPLFCTTAFSQSAKNLINYGSENYQSTFFTNFYYDDFSYRFIDSRNVLNQSFGKRILSPGNSTLSLNDSSALDSLKAISNIYLILGSKKNQALQLENIQRIGKSTFLYLNYNSVASLGFVKNSASKNRSFNIALAHHSTNYDVNGSLLIASNYHASSGGISDSVIPRAYSKRDLQQLNVYLPNDFIKKNFFKIDLHQKVSLSSSTNGEKKLLLSIKNNYSKFSYSYNGDGANPFYEYLYYDSVATNDTCGYNWLTNKLGFEAKIKNVDFFMHAVNENYNFRLQDSNYYYNDWSIDAGFNLNKHNLIIHGNYTKNISNNFRKNNQNGLLNFFFILNNGLIKTIEVQSNYSSINAPFVYQKQFSNHFVWDSAISSPVIRFYNTVNIGLGNNISFSISNTNYKNRVFLNENIVPEVSVKQENIASIELCYNDTIGKLHLVENVIYNSSNSLPFPIIPIQSYTRIGYMFSMFKNNLKVEAGISGVYNDTWYATSYSPAIDDFYLQSKSKFGGLTVLNLFADFKIKSATLFLKVERVNIGWFNENNFIREGYLAPPRTIRFGFNWPLTN